ncbi:unnamed protein product [Nesidiocoris tenuis]|uniref:Uncharacterized protein n=2 Tax=Nesidiocoris tenuis TaxID=355587 RepID=A0A6H5GG72_9HEMI|nr:Hypothetical protein NTJ_03044 [Nesidiocoris tenuis]CAB0000979.1 unnamed protein product [Nesidiocoris tenuis]
MASHHGSDATPICRCRVLYLGSAVPHITKDGLQGIQEPLRELYPEMGALSARGIDSWLSVWSNGILLENVDENHKKVTRFFPIDTLHYCAAVRYVLVPEKSSSSATGSASQPRFLPLDSPFARSPNPNHPPLFACILRRTTGIKVLECHTFICKREMAANALVRCCFHAYADSSYARSIDNPGYGTVGGPGSAAPSTYGTLTKDCMIGSSASSIDKVDGWRKMMPADARAGGMGGSTLTLDSAVVHNSSASPTYNNAAANAGSQSLVINSEFSRSQDDVSVYNGDENHKIWAGSNRDASDGEEAIYGEYTSSTMKSQRSSRPRQIVSAAPPPPPPPNEEKKSSSDAARRKKKSSGESAGGGGSREEVYPPGMNGSLLRPGSHHYHNTVRSHGSGAGMPPMMRYPPNAGHPPPPPLLVPMPPSTIPHLRRAGKGGNGGGRLPPPQMIPAPAFHHMPPPQPPPPMFIQGGKKGKPYPLSMEEPIYMPSNRPMSPVSSYQPCHFPIEAYLMHHYATMTPTTKKKKNKKGSNGGTMMMPPPQMLPVLPPPPPHMTPEEWGDAALYGVHPMHRNGGPKAVGRHPPPPMAGHHHYPPPPPPGHHTNGGHHIDGPDPRDAAHDADDGDEDGGGDDSPYNTGIYRRKGHINERAFSYSIRQEHRSRSYGSLANLKFAPLPVVPSSYYEGGPVEGNGTGNRKEEIKKEREIMQMMQDLDLSGDDIERSEVPANMYQRGGGAGTGPRSSGSRPVDPRRS